MHLPNKNIIGMDLKLLIGIITILSISLFFLLIIIIFTKSEGCFHRYGEGGNVNLITKTVDIRLRADGKYNSQSGKDEYGQWFNTDIHIYKDSDVTIRVKGKVSLCRAYLPEYNTVKDGNKNKLNKLIPIPKVDEEVYSNQELSRDKIKRDKIKKYGLPLVLGNARHNNAWRNIIKIDPLDEVVITLQNEKKDQVSEAIDVFASKNLYSDLDYIHADCRSGKTEYLPICGKFSIFKESNAAYRENKIIAYGDSSKVREMCKLESAKREFRERKEYMLKLLDSIKKDLGNLEKNGYRNLRTLLCDCEKEELPKIEGERAEAILKEYYDNFTCNLKESKNPLTIFGTFVKSAFTNIVAGRDRDTYMQILNFLREERIDRIGKIRNLEKSIKELDLWYSARDAAGLIYKIDANKYPDPNLGTNYKSVQKIIIPQELQIKESDLGEDRKLEKFIKSKLDKNQKPKEEDRTIYTLNYQINDDADTNGYLKMRFYDPCNLGYTGGYVVNIKQTKCVAIDGSLINYGDYENRGQIKYTIISNESENPNNQDITSRSKIGEPISLDNLGEGKFQSSKGGTLWLYLNNKPEDYENSTGEYGISVDFSYNTEQRGSILNKLFGDLKGKIKDTMKAAFRKITNFEKDKADAGHDFFNYVRALLILYVMIYGFMFLLGAVKINQYDLVIRVVKIAIIAGLLNGQTYEFFDKYVFDFVTGFCDQILSNFSGDNLFTGDRKASNPMIFLENIVKRIFLDNTFVVQIFALFSKGFLGIVLYMIIMLAIIILVINIIKAIASYLLSYLALALLLGILAPIFLSFLLFETTKDIAHNLIKASVYYMIEPIILIFGQIVFCQLFTIYLDNVLSYSVCWKCTFPINIIDIFTPLGLFAPSIKNTINENIGILGLPIFCIPWYAPWGYDPTNDNHNMVNFTDCVVLLILAFGMHGYTNLAKSISGELIGKAHSMIDVGSGPVDSTIKKLNVDSAIKKLEQAQKKVEEMAKEIASDQAGGTAQGAPRGNMPQN